MPHVPFFRLARCCYPGDIATIGGEGGGQLGRHQSFWNWPNSRHQQEAQQAQQRSWIPTGNASKSKGK